MCWPLIYRPQQFRLRKSKAQWTGADYFILNPVSRFDTSPSGVPGANLKVSFEVVDFFGFSVPDGQRFNLIYDYT